MRPHHLWLVLTNLQLFFFIRLKVHCSAMRLMRSSDSGLVRKLVIIRTWERRSGLHPILKSKFSYANLKVRRYGLNRFEKEISRPRPNMKLPKEIFYSRKNKSKPTLKMLEMIPKSFARESIDVQIICTIFNYLHESHFWRFASFTAIPQQTFCESSYLRKKTFGSS